MAAITTFSSTSFSGTDSLQNHHGEFFDDGKTFDSFSVCMSKLSSSFHASLLLRPSVSVSVTG